MKMNLFKVLTVRSFDDMVFSTDNMKVEGFQYNNCK